MLRDYSIFKSEDKKPPKGFEKFFKKREEREKEVTSEKEGSKSEKEGKNIVNQWL